MTTEEFNYLMNILPSIHLDVQGDKHASFQGYEINPSETYTVYADIHIVTEHNGADRVDWYKSAGMYPGVRHTHVEINDLAIWDTVKESYERLTVKQILRAEEYLKSKMDVI
jgi:uncharacterized protein with HEPN domain